MSTLHREPLDENERRIRLLRIQLIDDKAQYSLIQAPVDRAQYCALSYTWGDHKNRRKVQIDGGTLNVTANLSRALEDAARFFKTAHPDQAEVLLWADQICINQRDDDEKSHQVSMMGDIYQNAQQVLIWLPLGRDIKFGYKNWDAWNDWHRQQIESPQSTSVPQGRVAMSYSSISQPRQDFPVFSEGDSVVKNQLQAWDNIHSIITSPWWERAWGFSEFMLSKNAAFLFGGLSTSMESFQELIELYERNREAHSKFCTLTHNMLKHQEGQGAKESKFCGCFGRKRKTLQKDPATAKEQRQYLRRHSQHLINLAPYWSRVNGYFKAKAERNAEERINPIHLSTLMRQARNCKVSDPRDRLYALLSLAGPGHKIKIDYSLSVSAVLTGAARSIIQKDRRLDVFAMACEDKSTGVSSWDLPSWVPSWSTKNDPDSPYREFLRQIQYPMARQSYGGGGAGTRASESSSPVVFFFPDGILQAKGIFVDRLAALVAEDESKLFRTFVTEMGRKVSTVRKAEVGDEIWIFFGADEVFTLHKEDELYSILGHAMVKEANGQTSDVLLGSMMDRLREGAVSASDIRIR